MKEEKEEEEEDWKVERKIKTDSFTPGNQFLKNNHYDIFFSGKIEF